MGRYYSCKAIPQQKEYKSSRTGASLWLHPAKLERVLPTEVKDTYSIKRATGASIDQQKTIEAQHLLSLQWPSSDENYSCAVPYVQAS